ncbi:MAG: hypothetical protein ACD_4C00342G0006 [uncultured bacterium (gcode 4)]|uniref:Uncharacterized protein n=1 Tax=uncultured bacterium (gcode 4) TaxID=1234023 RepID=K2FTQ7_9BACT|nr:MAG: hypothetical protein ACD_4C00342G0006 [uncultured bacterium (gcode 4)]
MKKLDDYNLENQEKHWLTLEEIWSKIQKIEDEISDMLLKVDSINGNTESGKVKLDIYKMQLDRKNFDLKELREIEKKLTNSNEIINDKPFNILSWTLKQEVIKIWGKALKPKSWHTRKEIQVISISEEPIIEKTNRNNYKIYLNFWWQEKQINIEYFGNTINVLYNSEVFQFNIEKKTENLVTRWKWKYKETYIRKPTNFISFWDITLELWEFK